MNVLEIKITRDDSKHARVTIWINGVVVNEPHPIDLRELARSCFESGNFYIFTCGCGDSGCANIHEGVQVTHDLNTTWWRFRRPQSMDGFSDREEWTSKAVEHEYDFARSAYLKAITTAITDADHSHPLDTEYSPYGFERIDLHDLAIACQTKK